MAHRVVFESKWSVRTHFSKRTSKMFPKDVLEFEPDQHPRVSVHHFGDDFACGPFIDELGAEYCPWCGVPVSWYTFPVTRCEVCTHPILPPGVYHAKHHASLHVATQASPKKTPSSSTAAPSTEAPTDPPCIGPSKPSSESWEPTTKPSKAPSTQPREPASASEARATTRRSTFLACPWKTPSLRTATSSLGAWSTRATRRAPPSGGTGPSS